eukprot:COSAG02_NODE_3976_length_5963_cov_1.633015_1_plen_296_part_00
MMAEEGTPPPMAELRAELSALKPRALKKRAAEVGVDEEKIDEADDADDVKGTLIALIVEKEEAAAGAARIHALRTELEAMKPRALKKRAAEVGVDEEKLDEADDADDVKGTLIALIIEKAEGGSVDSDAAGVAAAAVAEAALAQLREELEGLKPRALKKRAAEEGVAEDKVDEADDADDVKSALIALILEKVEPQGVGPVDVAPTVAAKLTPHQGAVENGGSASADQMSRLFGKKHVILSCESRITCLKRLCSRDFSRHAGCGLQTSGTSRRRSRPSAACSRPATSRFGWILMGA